MTGLLKIGTKNLYVFDENGETKQVPAQCVLDFYIHESRQRAGLGREMFELMLQRENVEAQKLAIDRPSDKLIAFLRKHYGMGSIHLLSLSPQIKLPHINKWNFVVVA